VDFIRQCCRKSIAERPTAIELLAHPFVRNATDKTVLRPFYDPTFRKV
jgi:serine/threonine protein kinase